MGFKVSTVLEYNRYIAIDIGAFKIKVLICEIENGEIKVLGSATLRQSKRDMLDGEIANLHGVSASIRKAILKAAQDLDEIPEDVIIGINSSELLYDTIGMNYVRQDPSLPITMEEIDDIIKNIEHKAFARIQGKIDSRLGIIDSEMKLVTTSITSITLDGQRISNPIGFTGKNIKLNLIHLFVPLSKFNSIKNVIRDLDKNIISIVPSAITLPKITEDTPYHSDYNLFVDFGYAKSTIILENNSEILGSNVLPFGLSLLEEEIKKENPDLGHLDLENILISPQEHYEKYKSAFDRFFSLLFDTIFIASTDISKQLYLKNVFLSGGGTSDLLSEKLKEYLHSKSLGVNIQVMDFPTPEFLSKQKIKDPTMITVASLAKAWQEILLLKKDPIARILRYVIYRYE